jgi:hypothetical protein
MRSACLVTVLASSLLAAGCSEDEEPSGTGGGSSGSGAAGSSSSSSSSAASSGAGAVGGGGSPGVGGSGGEGGAGGGVMLTPGWFDPPPDLANDKECLVPAIIYPAPGEAGHLYAVRLTPPSYPYAVTSIQYELVGGAGCLITSDHRVEVFVSTETVPPNAPTLVATIDIDGAAAEGASFAVESTLQDEVVLLDGEHLFVAVELPIVEGSCIAVCKDAPVVDRDYWSNAAASPYNWATLASFGYPYHARIGVNGAPQ